MYTVKVIVLKKWCKIDTLLLYTTNKKYHIAYLFVPFPMTLDDTECHSVMQDYQMQIDEHLCDSLTWF